MGHNRQGSNASQGGKGSGIVGFQRVTTGKDRIPTASDISSSTQVQEREDAGKTQPNYDALQARVWAKMRGQTELDERTEVFSELEPTASLSGREVDLLQDACENSVPDMVDVNAGRKAIEYARRDEMFGSQMREVFLDSRTGGLRPGLVESGGNFASSELGMLHEMYLVQRDNPEWKPLYNTTCAIYQYIHSRKDRHYPSDGSYLYLDMEVKRMGVKFPDANSQDPVEMRLNDALAEGWYGPNAG